MKHVNAGVKRTTRRSNPTKKQIVLNAEKEKKKEKKNNKKREALMPRGENVKSNAKGGGLPVDSMDSSDEEAPLDTRKSKNDVETKTKISNKKDVETHTKKRKETATKEDEGEDSSSEEEDSGEEEDVGITGKRKQVLKKQRKEPEKMKMFSTIAEEDKKDEMIKERKKQNWPPEFMGTNQRENKEDDYEEYALKYGVGTKKGEPGSKSGSEDSVASESDGDKENRAHAGKKSDNEGEEDEEEGEEEEGEEDGDEDDGSSGEEDEWVVNCSAEDEEIERVEELLKDNDMELEVWSEFKAFIERRRRKRRYGRNHSVGGGRKKTVVAKKFQKLLVDRPNFLLDFARMKVFKECKFFIDELEAKAYCVVACQEYVSIPENDIDEFAESFHGIMAERIARLRLVASGSAAAKVRSKLHVERKFFVVCIR